MSEDAEPIVRMPVRVRFHECDPQGVVFNAHYLAYADMASFETIKELFGSHSHLVKRGIDLVVAESTLRYRGACRFDEDLSVDTYVDRVGTASLVLRFDITRAGELVTEVINRYVWVGAENLQPVRPPEDVSEAFQRFSTAG